MSRRPSHRILIIAGAGASTQLGRPEPLPLMTQWSDALVDALDAIEPGMARAMKLENDLAGDVFEQRLGEFLAFHATLSAVKRFGALGKGDLAANEPYLIDWLRRAENRCAAALLAIHKNLYESFGYRRFDDSLAEKAYSGLRTKLGEAGAVEPNIWFATTNYDWAIEAAFRRMNFTVLDGFHQEGLETPILEPLGIADNALDTNGLVPVIHLHGAVGWYRSDEGVIRKQGGDLPLNPSLGAPALLLPDNTKSVSSLAGAETLWDEFQKLLLNSSHVMFLGHSLNDRHLVEVVRGHSKPIAVCSRRTASSPGAGEPRGTVNSAFPHAIPVRTEFNEKPDFDLQALRTWLAE